MNGFLESWMDPVVWSNTWQPLPLHLGPNNDLDINIRRYAVTPEDVAEFKERGYWISPKIVDDETLKILREETTRAFKGEIDYPCGPYEYDNWLKSVRDQHLEDLKARKINNAWYVNSAYRKISTNESIGFIGSQLLGTDEIRLWHDQAIWKPAEGKEGTGESNIGWHQDYGYWQISNTTNMVTAWIPLQDVNIENGAMRTIVGSHKWGLVEDSTAFFDKDMDKLKEKFASKGGSWVDEPCVMKAGQVAFHHSLTFHGSGPNLTDTPRLAIALHLLPKGCAYAPGHGHHHNLKDLGPNARSGSLYAGDNFPLMYRKRRPSNLDYP